MKFCTNCGSSNASDTEFCSNCGEQMQKPDQMMDDNKAVSEKKLMKKK